MTPPPVYIERLAGFAEAVRGRLVGPVEAVDSGLERIVDVGGVVLLALPVWVVIACFGLAVWRGRHLRRAIGVVIALHLVFLAGLWAEVMETLTFATVVGGLGIGLIRGFDRVLRRWRPPATIVLAEARPAVTALVAVAVVALTPLVSEPFDASWTLIGILIVVLLGGPGRELASARGPLRRLPAAVLLPGIASALLTGLMSGAGLGGSAARAIATADVALAIQVVLATVGSTVAVLAGLGIGATLAEEPTGRSRDTAAVGGART